MTGAKTILLPEGSRLEEVMHKGRSRKPTRQVQLGFHAGYQSYICHQGKEIVALQDGVGACGQPMCGSAQEEQELTMCYEVPVLANCL